MKIFEIKLIILILNYNIEHLLDIFKTRSKFIVYAPNLFFNIL